MTKEVETPEVKADEVETSEVDDGVDLEDMEISFDDADESESEESEEASEEEPEEDDAETDTEEVESEESEEESEEPEASDEAEESEEDKDAQLSDEDKLKQHNKEMAEKRIQEREARELEIKRQQNDYVAEADDDQELAVRQLQVEAYNTKVERNENKLKTDFERSITDFKVFNDNSPEIQAELDQALDTFQRLHVTIDQWGNPSDVRGDLYSYLKTKAESIERLTNIGAKKESNAKSKSKSNTLTPPSRTPKEPKKDEAIDAFDEEADRY